MPDTGFVRLPGRTHKNQPLKTQRGHALLIEIGQTLLQRLGQTAHIVRQHHSERLHTTAQHPLRQRLQLVWLGRPQGTLALVVGTRWLEHDEAHIGLLHRPLPYIVILLGEQLHATQALHIRLARQHLDQRIVLRANHAAEHLVAQRPRGPGQQQARQGPSFRAETLCATQGIEWRNSGHDCNASAAGQRTG